MPERYEQHRCIPMSVTVGLCGLDQLLDFARGEVFTAPILAICQARRTNCSVLVPGDTNLRKGFIRYFLLLGY